MSDVTQRAPQTGYVSREAQRRVDERVRDIRARQEAALRALRKAQRPRGNPTGSTRRAS